MKNKTFLPILGFAAAIATTSLFVACTSGTGSSTDTPTSSTYPSSYSTQPYRGVNLSGAEYGDAFHLPSVDDSKFYAQHGMNTIRLPFAWEYLQESTTNVNARVKDPSVPINFNYPKAKAYAALVNQLTESGMYVIIDMHNYMRYGTDNLTGTVGIIGSDTAGAPTAQQYAGAWVDIGTEFKTNNKVMFDLMNEPNNMSTQLVLDNYNVVIAALRNVGINNVVLLEGNGWTGAHSWTDTWYDTANPKKSNATVFVPSAIHDTTKNYVINVHQYFDSDYSGTQNDCQTSLPSTLISGLTNYLTQYNLTAMVTEFGGASTQNCANDINSFLNTLTPSYIGWTGWAGGSIVEGLNGTTRQTDYFGPLPDGTQTITMTGGFQPHLTMPAQ